MDAKEIERRISRVKDEIQKEVTDRLPRKVGVVAANHFKQNFRDGGFTDGGVKQWKRTKRQDGNTKDAKYSPLTSRRNHLMRSIESEPSPGQVTISNPVPYAAVHNEGSTINTHPTITKKMRRMAWAKVYALSGVKGKGKHPKDLPSGAKMWKALALTKKTKLNITARIPRRQFIGDSRELTAKINKMLDESLEKIKELVSRT